MNPELTRTTHDPAVLATQSEHIFNSTTNTGTLVDTRKAYVEAKAVARKGSGLFGFGANQAANTDMEAKRAAYQTQNNNRIQIEARRMMEADAAITEFTGDAAFQQELGRRVGELVVNEIQTLTQQEIEAAIAGDNSGRIGRLRGILNRFQKNPLFRTGAGWTLNAGIGFAIATGNPPMAAAFLAGRAVLGAYGTEGFIRGSMTDRMGDRGRNLNVAGMGMAEVDRRLGAFAEMHVRDRSTNLLPEETLLLQRKRDLIAEEVRVSVSSGAPHEQLRNWKRLRANATNAEATKGAEETARATAETERDTQEQNRKNAEDAMKAAKDKKDEEETKKSDAEAARVNAEAVIVAANSILKESTDPAGPRDGFIKMGVPLADVENAAQRHVNADKEIARLRGLPTPPAGLNTLIHAQEMLRDAAHMELYNTTWNVEAVVDAFGDRAQARIDIPLKITERDDAATAATNAETERAAKEIEMNNAITARDAAETEMKNKAAARDLAEDAVNAANNLSTDQALIVYDRLLGGSGRALVAGRAPVPGPLGRPGTPNRLAIGATANGLLGGEGYNTAQEAAIARERTIRLRRWIAAGTVGAFVTAVTTPTGIDWFKMPFDINLGDAGEWLKNTNLTQLWNSTFGNIDVAQAADNLRTAAQGVLPDSIPLPAGSDPWNEAAKILQQQLGRSPNNNEIYALTKLISENSNISVPSWNVAGGVDHKSLPTGFSLKLGSNALALINSLKGP